MISKIAYIKKMLRNFLIFGLLFVATHADGKFAVLQAPDSIEFKGEQPIPGIDVGDVILAATGNTISDDVQWSGLSIVDPFNLPTKAVVALVDGASIDIESAKFAVPLESAGVGDSLEMLIAEMKATKTSTCHIDYSSKQASKTAHKCFGNAVQPKENKPALPATTALNSEDAAAKNFLAAIADLNDAVDGYLKLKENKDVELRSLVVIHMSLAPIVQAYGADSPQQAEAVALVQKTIAKLQKAAGDALFVTLTGTSAEKTRSKRDTVAPNTKNELNLAEYYDSDYPVIFNIILWFMIVFGLSLLAISYAIGSMDPGKDSIIYRMTSTRMKKDN